MFKKAPQDRKKTLRYGDDCLLNGGFLGNPIIEGVYGTSGIVLRFHFYDPGADCDVECWNIGIFKREERKYFEKGADASVYYRSLCRRNTNGNRSCIAGVSDENYSGLSSCNTPLSMMLVGMMLAEMNPRGLIDRTMLFYTGVRLIVIPGVVFLLTMFLDIDPLLRGIAVIIAGMPAPITTALLSAKYDGDETYATGMIFVTTIVSLITLPIWCVALGM